MVEWGGPSANTSHGPLVSGFSRNSYELHTRFPQGCSSSQQSGWNPQCSVAAQRPGTLVSNPNLKGPEIGFCGGLPDASSPHRARPNHMHIPLLRPDSHGERDGPLPCCEREAKPDAKIQSSPKQNQASSFRDRSRTPIKRQIVLNARCARLEKPLIEQCARELDWTLSESPDGPADVAWFGTAIAEAQYRNVLASTHIVNRLPSLQEIVRKRWLSRILNILKIVDPQRMRFVPETYLLPDDAETVRHCLSRAEYGSPLFATPSAYATYPKTAGPKDGKVVFILKPDAGAQGSGLKLINRFEDIPASVLSGAGGYICQRYIDNPLKLNKRKFDIRVYVLITQIVPEFEAYIGSEALTRFCTVDYVPADRSNFKNTFMHFTNYSINKENTHHYLRSTDLRSPLNSKRPLEDVLKDLAALGYNPKQIWQQILKIVSETLNGLKPFVSLAYKCVMAESQLWKMEAAELHNRCFQILGFDILLDETGKAWLLEVNSNPSLRTSFEAPQAKKLDILMASQYIAPASHIEASQWRRKGDVCLPEVGYPLASLSPPVGEGSVDYMIKKPLVFEALKVVQYQVNSANRRVANQEAAQPRARNPSLPTDIGYNGDGTNGVVDLLGNNTGESDSTRVRRDFPTMQVSMDLHRSRQSDGPRELVYNQEKTQVSKRLHQGDAAAESTSLFWHNGAPYLNCVLRRDCQSKKVFSPGYPDAKADYSIVPASRCGVPMSKSSSQTALVHEATNKAEFFASLQYWMPIIVPENDYTALLLGLRNNPQTIRAKSHPVTSCWVFAETAAKPEKQLIGGAQYPVGAGLLTCCQYLYEQATHFPECLTLRLSHWELFAAMSGLRTIVSYVQVPCFFPTKTCHSSSTVIPPDDSNFGLSNRLSSALAGTTRRIKIKKRPILSASENVSHLRGSQTYGCPLFHADEERASNVLTRSPTEVTSLEKRAVAAGLGVRELPSRCVATRPLSWADLRWLFCRPRRRDPKCRNPGSLSSCYGCDTLRDRHSTLHSCSSHPERCADLGFWGFWELLLQIASLIHTAEAAGKRDKDRLPAAAAHLNRCDGPPGRANHSNASFTSPWKMLATSATLLKGKHSAMYAQSDSESTESQRLQRCATKILQWWPDSQKIVKKVLELDPQGIGITLHRLVYALVANVQVASMSRKQLSGDAPTETTKWFSEGNSTEPSEKETRSCNIKDNDSALDFRGSANFSDSTRPGDE